MKGLTKLLTVVVIGVLIVGVVLRVIGSADGGGESTTPENTARVERARSVSQGTPTPTLVPPTRTPTPPRPTPLPGQRPTIRLSDEKFESQALNNAIARFVIEHGFGYQTETVVTTGLGMQDQLVKGDIDLEMEGWQHNRLQWYDDAIRNQKIENLGQTYESGPQFFIISSGPHHQDSGEAKIRESTAGVSRKPSSDGKARGSSSKHLCGLTAWNT